MLDSLLKPKSIMVVGASQKKGKVGYEILANLKNGGFEGTLVPVNPKAAEIQGLTCYNKVSDYKGKVDLGIITVPAKAVEQSVHDLVENGARSIVIITAGFKEIGPEGAEVEKRIARFCQGRRIRVLGPNVVGLINTHHKMNASFALEMPKPGAISVLAQSGAICTVLVDWAKGKGVGLAKLISIGNKADVTEVDLLAALAEDEETNVIAGYLEDVHSGKDFIAAAEAAGRVKPVVLMKAGTTQAGKKAASSHTGSLAGQDIAYGAAFKRAGIIRAETFEEMLDYSTALSMQPLPAGARTVVVTNAGGLGIIAADAVENQGLEMASLSEETDKKLKEILSPAASTANPVDILGDAGPETYAGTLRILREDPGVDAMILLFAPQAMSDPVSTAEAMVEATRGGKTTLASFVGGEAVEPARAALLQNGVPEYPAPERAVAALAAMTEYDRWKNRPPRIVTRFAVNRRRVERLIHRHVRLGRKEIGEVEAKQILKAYGFQVPEGRVARNSDEAVEIAEYVGYPVAMKIYSPDILHKSDMGGVKINLGTPQEVKDAFDLMTLRIGRRMPEARLDGAYVEKMAPRGREVIIGMSRDDQFGPMLMFGLGGIFVEVMKDVTFHLAPVTEKEAMQMLEGTRSFALLKGVRGQKGVDLNLIAAGIQKISQLVTDFPEILELDINPFIVGGVGENAYVADARMTIALEAK